MEKIDLDKDLINEDHIVVIKKEDLEEVLDKKNTYMFLRFINEGFKEIEETDNIVDHMYISSILFEKIKNIFDKEDFNCYFYICSPIEAWFWTSTIHIDDKFHNIYLTNGEKGYYKLKEYEINL